MISIGYAFDNIVPLSSCEKDVTARSFEDTHYFSSGNGLNKYPFSDLIGKRDAENDVDGLSLSSIRALLSESSSFPTVLCCITVTVCRLKCSVSRKYGEYKCHTRVCRN